MSFSDEKIVAIIQIAEVLWQKVTEAEGKEPEEAEHWQRILSYAIRMHEQGIPPHAVDAHVGDLLVTYKKKKEEWAPNNPELVGKILQYQLKVEHHLLELIDAFYPGLPTKVLNLTYNKAVNVIGQRKEFKDRQPFIAGLKDLGSVRNKFAHNLNHSITHNDVKRIMQWFVLKGAEEKIIEASAPVDLYYDFCDAATVELHTWNFMVSGRQNKDS